MKQYKCLRPTCNHVWYPRKPGRPAVCPKCHSAIYDRPRGIVVKRKKDGTRTFTWNP